MLGLNNRPAASVTEGGRGTAIEILPNGTLQGAADPRRDGVAMGE